MTKPHEYYMSQALKLAREAADAGEVPVGCVIVRDGAVIGRGRNRREEKQAVCSHAEMEAMAQANAALGSWRLDNCAEFWQRIVKRYWRNFSRNSVRESRRRKVFKKRGEI